MKQSNVVIFWLLSVCVTGLISSDTPNLPNAKRIEEYILRAKIAEQAERYDDMAKAMKAVSESGDHSLSPEERNLFSLAFKNEVGARRSSWRVVSSIVENEESNDKKREIAIEYRDEIKGEIADICNEVLALLDDHIATSDSKADNEAKVFFLKMKGDYLRYLVEQASSADENFATTQKQCIAAYQAASEAAESMGTTHPLRLGLALNFSVFRYEVLQQKHEGCSIAKKAFDDAIADLDELKEDNYKDSTLIMQLLRDNLTVWTCD